MVEVISIQKRTCTCDECGAVLSYTRTDMQLFTHSKDYIGGVERNWVITCPVCNNKVFVKNYDGYSQTY